MKTPSVEPVLRSRLLPRVSFRFFLALTALSAAIAAVARAAGEGGAIAYAAMIGGIFLASCFVMFAVTFLVSWSVSALWYRGEPDTQQGSPFADGQLPPQILPPRDQNS